MSTVHIGARQPLPEFESEVKTEFSRLEKSGVSIKIKSRELGKYSFFECSLLNRINEENQEESFRLLISRVITSLLLGRITKDFILRMTRIDHPYLTKEEAWTICDQVASAISASEEKGRRFFIEEEVRNFLKDSNQILLEGFLRFRLQGYFMELKESLEEAIDRLLVDKEYQEFIRLLQYFVEMQEPKVAEVHVLFYDQDNFRLLDEDAVPLDQEYLSRVLGNPGNEDLKYEDLLLSALITLAPQRIILHHKEGQEVAQTIASVFTDRVTFCRSCELCRNCQISPSQTEKKE